MKRVVNPLVRAILRSPWHRLLSGTVLVLTYTGRRTGRRYSIPVQYAPDQEALIVLVGQPQQKRWWRNLRDGASVTVELRGRQFQGHAHVVGRDPDARASTFRAYATRFPRTARSAGPADRVVLVRIERLRPDGP